MLLTSLSYLTGSEQVVSGFEKAAHPTPDRGGRAARRQFTNVKINAAAAASAVTVRTWFQRVQVAR